MIKYFRSHAIFKALFLASAFFHLCSKSPNAFITSELSFLFQMAFSTNGSFRKRKAFCVRWPAKEAVANVIPVARLALHIVYTTLRALHAQWSSVANNVKMNVLPITTLMSCARNASHAMKSVAVAPDQDQTIATNVDSSKFISMILPLIRQPLIARTYARRHIRTKNTPTTSLGHTAVWKRRIF